MWTKGNDGSVFWSEAAKILLIGLLKRNPDAINSGRSSPKKTSAWKKVYESLIKAGMPKTSIIRVKKCWSRTYTAAKVQHAEQLKNYSRQGRLTPLSKLNQAVINLLNDVNSRNIQNMPKPKVEVKKEPIDTWDEPQMAPVEETRKSTYNQLERKMNPVVKLNRIDCNINKVTESPSNNLSVEYWALMQEIAKNDLKLKLSQLENEEERMEMEREIHRKNMILMELKIKVQQIQIEGLQGHNNFD